MIPARRPGRALARSAVVFFLAPFVLLGCPDRPRGKKEQGKGEVAALKVHGISIRDTSVTAFRVKGLKEAELRAWAEKSLRQERHLALVSQRGPGTYRIDLEVGLVLGTEEMVGKECPVILGSARGEVPGSMDAIVLQSGILEPVSERELKIGARERLRVTVQRLIGDMGYQADLVTGDERRLLQALKEKEVPRLSAAVEIVAVRRAQAAVPQLIKLLHHQDPRISDRVIGALVAVGDTRAVKPLTRLVHLGDTARMAKILDAIGALGGSEAKDYLEFIAAGHEDEDIRNLAAEALERMSRTNMSRTKKRRNPKPGSSELQRRR